MRKLRVLRRVWRIFWPSQTPNQQQPLWGSVRKANCVFILTHFFEWAHEWLCVCVFLPHHPYPARAHAWMEKCMNGLRGLNQSRARHGGKKRGDDRVREEGWCDGDGNPRWERESERMWSLSSGVAELDSPLDERVAPEKDHAIKMIQSWDFGHDQGNIYYTYPCFHYAADCAQHWVLLSSTPPLYCLHFSRGEFIRNWPRDKCAELKTT